MPETFNERELDILRLIAEGLSNRAIAGELVIALDTVKWYNKQIFAKLQVNNRVQAVARAEELGLLDTSGEAIGSQAPLPRHNLPAHVTSFIGRRREIAETKNLLKTSRLLTITGPGGCGKTRLALQIATEALPDFRDGAYFVPLAPLAVSENILWTIAEHIGFRFQQQGNPLAQILQNLEEKHLLLVLDNFEHLLDGAGLLAEILRGAQGVKMLVTSRERLSLYGEVSYTLGGMSLAAEDNRGRRDHAESVQLFIQRAQTINTGLELGADELPYARRICQLVDGMPLGIELAATWVDTLLPEEIAREIEHSLDILETALRGIPRSQRSIRAVFGRSWDLLDAAQQAAFRRLAVFRGGFTREAAEAVTGVQLRTLQALVRKSLLGRDPDSGRYEIHELLRHYAEEQLIFSREADDVYETYARYFANFMAERWPLLKGHQQKDVLLEIESDIENARAAWAYWIQAEDAAELNKFFQSFWIIYDIRGWYPSGIELFEQGANVLREKATEEARAGLGWLLAVQGLFTSVGGVYNRVGGSRKGFALAQQGVEILRRLNIRDERLAAPLVSLFITASHVNKPEIATQAAQDYFTMATELGDRWFIASAKQFQAIRAIIDGDYETAEQLAHEALNTFQEIGDNWALSALCIEVLGLLAINLCQFDRAKEWILRGLEAAEAIDFTHLQQMAYWQLGYVATLQDDFAQAGKYWHQALGIGGKVIGAPVMLGFGGFGEEWGGRRLIDG